MKFRPGQKVLVLEEYKTSMVLEMRKFIGKVVTISDVIGNERWPYRITEDLRWVWAEHMFTDAMDSNDPNLLFQMRKGG